MNPSDKNPKLPTWLFIVTDLALIGAAGCIAYFGQPLTLTKMLVVVGCVGAGAIIALVPLIARYEAQKNEALDDRQRALEALAITVSASAEQISIAANGLHEIAELAQKNLRHAEQLPHKLQEKIAEFQAQLAVAQDAEKEELERELLALRTTESDRLESVSQRIAKSSAEWVKLEGATQQHLAAASDTLAKLSLGTASAIGKAQVAAEQALAQARTEAARSLGETTGESLKALAAAKSAALSELDAAVTAAARKAGSTAAAEIAERLDAVSQLLGQKVAQLAATIPQPHPAPSDSADTSPPPVAPLTPPAENPAPSAQSATSAVPSESSSEPTDAIATPPKRPRRPRREEPAPESPPAPPEESPAESSTAAADTSDAPHASAPVTASAPSAPEAEEPAPLTAEKIPEVTPVAPHTAEPFANHRANGSAPTEPAASAEPSAPAAAPAPDIETAKPARKRPVARKSEASPEPDPADEEPSLGLDEAASAPAASVSERVMTSDGATRLVVTAYIGIGNRLFIRGTGPGLSWEKGVPLQFVSIGKWRWETNDASGPVQFKLYKNDDLECAALGTQQLDPGHQQEVTAAF